MPPSVLDVLVVDDSEVLRAIVAQYLDDEADLRVTAAVGSGNAALAHTSTACPDVILLDHQMADGCGLDVLAGLRQRCPQARIVMFSAWTEVREQALRLGADGFLSKERPFDELADLLRV